jgi:hypothetical protein
MKMTARCSRVKAMPSGSATHVNAQRAANTQNSSSDALSVPMKAPSQQSAAVDQPPVPSTAGTAGSGTAAITSTAPMLYPRALGMIWLYAGGKHQPLPDGFLKCDGRHVFAGDYPDLFQLLHPHAATASQKAVPLNAIGNVSNVSNHQYFRIPLLLAPSSDTCYIIYAGQDTAGCVQVNATPSQFYHSNVAPSGTACAGTEHGGAHLNDTDNTTNSQAKPICQPVQTKATTPNSLSHSTDAPSDTACAETKHKSGGLSTDVPEKFVVRMVGVKDRLRVSTPWLCEDSYDGERPSLSFWRLEYPDLKKISGKLKMQIDLLDVKENCLLSIRHSDSINEWRIVLPHLASSSLATIKPDTICKEQYIAIDTSESFSVVFQWDSTNNQGQFIVVVAGDHAIAASVPLDRLRKITLIQLSVSVGLIAVAQPLMAHCEQAGLKNCPLPFDT